MKIILSRKGFDSGCGGCASPILPDGTLLSLPIPSQSTLHYSSLRYGELSYDEIYKVLAPKFYKSESTCHLDPDVRNSVRENEPEEWSAAFGQTSAAYTHLKNKNVGVGDVFLFFGWFKQCEYTEENILRYCENAPDLHIIYGYMQVGEIFENDKIIDYYWHPHSEEKFMSNERNHLYLPTKKLVLGDIETDLPGYGTFNFNEKFVLTKEGMTRTRWKVPPWFSQVDISYHSNKSFKEGYFQSACKGQEFVIQDNFNNEKWLKELLFNG